MKLYEKTLSSDTKFEGRIIRVLLDEVELENGKTAKREVVCHNGGVCVAALTEKDELLLVRQFRYPYKEVLLELPAGKLEKGETLRGREARADGGDRHRRRKLHFARESLSLAGLLRRDHPHLGLPCGGKRGNASR